MCELCLNSDHKQKLTEMIIRLKCPKVNKKARAYVIRYIILLLIPVPCCLSVNVMYWANKCQILDIHALHYARLIYPA